MSSLDAFGTTSKIWWESPPTTMIFQPNGLSAEIDSRELHNISKSMIKSLKSKFTCMLHSKTRNRLLYNKVRNKGAKARGFCKVMATPE